MQCSKNSKYFCKVKYWIVLSFKLSYSLYSIIDLTLSILLLLIWDQNYQTHVQSLLLEWNICKIVQMKKKKNGWWEKCFWAHHSKLCQWLIKKREKPNKMVASFYTWKMVKKFINTTINVTLPWKRSEVFLLRWASEGFS